MPSSGERVLLYRAKQTNEAAAFAECVEWKRNRQGLHREMLVQIDHAGRWWVTGVRSESLIGGETDAGNDHST